MPGIHVKSCLSAALGAAVFALSSSALPTPAGAVECGRHEKVIQLLGTRYQETRKAMGLVSTRGMMEVYVSAAGTWTVLLTSPEGIACIVAAGDAWEDAPMIAEGPAA